MSVADQFGLDDPDSPLLAEARAGWERWCAHDPALAVVEDLTHLRTWTRRASADERADLIAAIAALTAEDRSAVAALVWLLIPGASRIAASLGDLSPEIDALVAGELWVQAAQSHRLRTRSVAQAILNETRREVATSLGAGSRADRAWAVVVLSERLDHEAASWSDAGVAPETEAADFLEEAMYAGVIDEADVRLLYDLAAAADVLDAPAHRGRLGLTAPAVAERVAAGRRQAARTIRRRASVLLDRLAAYATGRSGDADSDGGAKSA